MNKYQKYIDYLNLHGSEEDKFVNLEVAKMIEEFMMGEDFVITALVRNLDCDILSETTSEYKNLLEGLSKLEISNTIDNTYEDYRNVLVIMAKDYRIIILELVYRLVMMRKYKKQDIENKKQYAKESLNIYAPIAHRLGLGQIKTELEELSLYFLDIDAFKNIVRLINVKKEQRDCTLDKMVSEIKDIVDQNTQKSEVFGRSKSIYSVYNKTVKKNKPIESIFDLQGIRIICQTKQECYLILGLIHEKFSPVSGRFKDYIALKKPNLYQSLHTAITNEVGDIFEIQIRTFEMDEIAERGIAAHWMYKEGGNSNLNDIEEQLHLFRDLIKTSEDQTEELGEQIFESSIFTYTPNKKIIHLPKDATVIDFAYRIHTKVAEQMVGAIVNGNIKPFDEPLMSGDTIEILTKKGASSVNNEWLDFAITNHARRKIKAYLKKQAEQQDLEYIVKGEELFVSYLKKLKIDIGILDDEKAMKSITSKFSCPRLSSFYKHVSTKEISFRDIEEFLIKDDKNDIKLIKDSSSISKDSIIVSGADGIKLIVASCCSPIPGDDIVGVISTGLGIKIHRDVCPNITGGNQIDATWNDNLDLKGKYEVSIVAFFEDRDNLIADVLSVFNKNSLGIKHIDSKVHGDLVKTKITTIVKTSEQLTHIMAALDSISGCQEVNRIIK